MAEFINNLSLEEKEAVVGIFSEKYYKLAYFNGVTYISHLILRLFKQMGILKLLESQPTPGHQIISEFNFLPKTKYALGWMLDFLSQGNFLKKINNNGGALYHYEGVENIDLEALLQKTIEQDVKIAPSAKLMDYVISEYPNFFSGLKNGLEILFAKDKMMLWNEYFSSDNSGYSVHNAFGTFAIFKWALKRNDIRLLEIGAGTGGATVSLLDKLKDTKQLCAISEYIFSDVSPVFLRLGNEKIMKRVGDDFNYSLKKLNFDNPIVNQGINKEEIDIVYGVNSLHVAKNLSASLKYLYDIIKPGGMIILSECCRPSGDYLLPHELIFNLLDNYVDVDLNPVLRPIPGFLDYEHWKRNLSAAGFINIETVFNTDCGQSDNLSNKVDILAAVIKGEKTTSKKSF